VREEIAEPLVMIFASSMETGEVLEDCGCGSVIQEREKRYPRKL